MTIVMQQMWKTAIRWREEPEGKCSITDECAYVKKNIPNRPFPSSPGPLFQNDGRCSAFDMKIIFHSRANKTHFHKKGCAPSLISKVRSFGTRKWPYHTYPMNPYALRTCALGASCHVLTDLKLNGVELSVFRYKIYWFITNQKFLVHYRPI